MTLALKTFTLDDVAKHNSEEDCWIVMNNKVYDLTEFLSEHPGGSDAITYVAGTDATSDFEDVGHSKDAKEMAAQYIIGELVSETESAPAETPIQETVEKREEIADAPDEDKQASTPWLNFLIPTAVGIIAYLIYVGAFSE